MAGTKSRLFSIVIAFLMVVSAIVIGGVRSLGNLKNDMITLYENGNYQYQETSVAEHLQIRSKEAYNLIAVAKNKNIDTQLIEQVGLVAEELEYAYDINYVAEANETLTQKSIQLYEQLEATDLTEHEKKTIHDARVNMEYANSAIYSSSYNEQVEKYNNTISTFPTNILTNIVGMDLLPVFEQPNSDR